MSEGLFLTKKKKDETLEITCTLLIREQYIKDLLIELSKQKFFLIPKGFEHRTFSIRRRHTKVSVAQW